MTVSAVPRGSDVGLQLGQGRDFPKAKKKAGGFGKADSTRASVELILACGSRGELTCVRGTFTGARAAPAGGAGQGRAPPPVLEPSPRTPGGP